MKKLALVLVAVFAIGISASTAATFVSPKAEVVKTMENEKKEKKAKSSDAKAETKKSCESKKCCSEKKEGSCGDKK